MKKTLLALLIAIPTVSTASERFYVGVDGGWSVSRVTKEGLFQDYYISKNTGVGTIKGGYAFDNGIRAELALSQYGNINADHGSGRGWIVDGAKYTAKSKTIMGNLYYDHLFTSDLSMYAMTGLGVAFNKLSVNSPLVSASESENGLAWQAGSGLSYAFTPNLIGDVGIKYVYRNNLNSTVKIDLASFDTTIGIRYMF